MTTVEKILLAGHELENKGRSPFSAEELVVKAWENDKSLFGLQGYSDLYPDSNRILTNIMGTKGLKGKGWIEKVGEKLYKLTASGTSIATVLADSARVPAARAGTIDRKEMAIVVRMLESPAFKKKIAQDEENILFRDACKFWGISSYSDASTVTTQFRVNKDVLANLEKAVAASAKGRLAIPYSKEEIDKEKVASLIKANEFLRTKFFNEIENLLKRRD
jgi:hypothetical protein